jgi:hypothetical protein
MGGPQKRSSCRKEKSLAPTENKTSTIQSVAIATELSRLHCTALFSSLLFNAITTENTASVINEYGVCGRGVERGSRSALMALCLPQTPYHLTWDIREIVCGHINWTEPAQERALHALVNTITNTGIS